MDLYGFFYCLPVTTWLYFLTIFLFILALIVQELLKKKVEKYSETTLASGKTGAEIARKMLDDFFIDDVNVVECDGFLSDNYNPITKTLSLSPGVYSGKDACSIGIAAHECGHAIQHNRGYMFLHLRSLLVPMVCFSSKFINIFLFLGFMLLNVSLIPFEIGVILYALCTLFSFITLPVEFNASSRAIDWIDENNIVNEDELKIVKSSLRLAALTYVLSALISFVELIRLLGILDKKKRD